MSGPWDLVVDVADFLPQHGDQTLETAQVDLLAKIETGLHCRCCAKWAKITHRPLNGTMGASLDWIVKKFVGQGSKGWIHIPSLGPRWITKTNQHPSLRLWGLVERRINEDKQQKHSGYWRPTPLGIAFARGHVRVPRGVYVYNDTPLRFDAEMVSLTDILGKEYDHRHTMSPAFLPPKVPRRKKGKKAAPVKALTDQPSTTALRGTLLPSYDRKAEVLDLLDELL